MLIIIFVQGRTSKMGDSQDKGIKPPAAKSRNRRTSVGDNLERNDQFQMILEKMTEMQAENAKLTEGLKQDFNRGIQDIREEMKGEVNSIRKTLDDVIQQVKSEVRTEVRAEMKMIDKKLDSAIEKVNTHEKVLEELSNKMLRQATLTAGNCEDICSFSMIQEKLQEKIIDLEARQRRSNLIFHGVQEEFGETNDMSKQIAYRLIREYCQITDTIVIQRAHRIGAPRAGKIRPLIVLFLDWSDKERVKEKKKSLPQGMYCTDDVPLEIREAKRKLQPEVQAAIARGDRCWVAWPARLIVNGVEVKRETPRYAGFAPTQTRQQGDVPGVRASYSQVVGQGGAQTAYGGRGSSIRNAGAGPGAVPNREAQHNTSVKTVDVNGRVPRSDVREDAQQEERMDDSPPCEGAEGGGPEPQAAEGADDLPDRYEDAVGDVGGGGA